MTTAMPTFKAKINAIEKAGLRDRVSVRGGWGPLTQDAVGAERYAADAPTAARQAKELTGRSGGLVSA